MQLRPEVNRDFQKTIVSLKAVDKEEFLIVQKVSSKNSHGSETHIKLTQEEEQEERALLDHKVSLQVKTWFAFLFLLLQGETNQQSARGISGGFAVVEEEEEEEGGGASVRIEGLDEQKSFSARSRKRPESKTQFSIRERGKPRSNFFPIRERKQFIIPCFSHVSEFRAYLHWREVETKQR